MAQGMRTHCVSCKARSLSLCVNSLNTLRIGSGRLCITAQRPEAWEQQEGKTVYSERRSRRIFRVLDLPSQIDPDLTAATLNDGILEITLLKADEMGKKVPVLAKAARA